MTTPNSYPPSGPAPPCTLAICVHIHVSHPAHILSIIPASLGLGPATIKGGDGVHVILTDLRLVLVNLCGSGWVVIVIPLIRPVLDILLIRPVQLIQPVLIN